MLWTGTGEVLWTGDEVLLCVEDCMVPDTGVTASPNLLFLWKHSENRQKKECGSSFLGGGWFAERLLRRVGGTARAGIGIPDECDALDDLLPGGLEPRVFVGLGRHLEECCVWKNVGLSECYCLWRC